MFLSQQLHVAFVLSFGHCYLSGCHTLLMVNIRTPHHIDQIHVLKYIISVLPYFLSFQQSFNKVTSLVPIISNF